MKSQSDEIACFEKFALTSYTMLYTHLFQNEKNVLNFIKKHILDAKIKSHDNQKTTQMWVYEKTTSSFEKYQVYQCKSQS